MDLIIYGEKKNSLEMMLQATADSIANHEALSRFFYSFSVGKNQFLKMDFFSLACIKEPLSSFLQTLEVKKECYFAVLPGFLTLQINSRPLWNCHGKISGEHFP